jgi:hypothetical protein
VIPIERIPDTTVADWGLKPLSFSLLNGMKPDWYTIMVWLILTFSRIYFCFDIVSRRSSFELGEKTVAVVVIDTAYRDSSFIKTRNKCNIGQLHPPFLSNPRDMFFFS